MIQFSVLYPYDENADFDFDYYLHHHAKMVKEKLGDALVTLTLERGISGLKSSSAPSHRAIATLTFRSADELRTHLYPHLAEISADIPNFTSIAPEILVSEPVE